MHWPKRDIWKAGIAIAGMLLLLVLMVWVPISVAGAYEGASGLATSVTGTIQETPTIDATLTALNKEKLLQDIDQQRHTLGNWFWNNGAALVSSLVLVIAGAFTLFRYLRDQRSEREIQREDRQTELEKRAEERFQSAVEGLSSEREEAKIGAAILLRTFLRPDYEQFYIQTFDLTVANLRLRRTSPPSEDPDGIPRSPEEPNTPLPLTTLRQALIVVFKEAFPLARSQNKGGPQSLDATYIQLDKAYLAGTDLKQAWMPHASLREANLRGASLRGADLGGANLGGANLGGADLREARLTEANLGGADLGGADLTEAGLRRADLGGAHLIGADLTGAHLRGGWLGGADLRRADLTGADLRGARYLEEVRSMEGANLRRVKGLTKEQLEACKVKDAIIDDETTTSPPQLPISPPAPTPSASPTQVSYPTPGTDGSSTTSPKPSPDAQTTSAPPAQVNTPIPDVDGNSAPSSQ